MAIVRLGETLASGAECARNSAAPANIASESKRDWLSFFKPTLGDWLKTGQKVNKKCKFFGYTVNIVNCLCGYLSSWNIFEHLHDVSQETGESEILFE